jgi:uncharacterized CHY-type Zn-finger protein
MKLVSINRIATTFVFMELKGKPVDTETRCVHYHSPLDIIAIRFKCCNACYSCFYCHEETAGHTPAVWSKQEFHVKAILCGVCKTEPTIAVYKTCNYEGPFCKASFNPECSNHDHLYFKQ